MRCSDPEVAKQPLTLPTATAIVVALLAGYFLCTSVDTASFLTPEERVYARARLTADGPRGTDSTAAADHDQFSWYQVRRAVFSIQTWLSASAYFCILSALYSFGESFRCAIAFESVC